MGLLHWHSPHIHTYIRHVCTYKQTYTYTIHPPAAVHEGTINTYIMQQHTHVLTLTLPPPSF